MTLKEYIIDYFKPPSFKSNFFHLLELKSDSRVKCNENKGKYGNVEDIVVFKLNSYHFYIASCSRNVEITLAHLSLIHI